MTATITQQHVQVDGLEVWVEQRGVGPDVLLIAGLSDPAEAWETQLEGLSDRYRVTAFDNPGAGRTGLPEGELTVAAMADDRRPGPATGQIWTRRGIRTRSWRRPTRKPRAAPTEMRIHSSAWNAGRRRPSNWVGVIRSIFSVTVLRTSRASSA